MNQDSGKALGTLTNVPNNVSFLGSNPSDSLSKSEITLNWHEDVRHLSISNFQPAEYYEDYFMTTTYSKSMQDLQRTQTDKFKEISLGECANGSFIEIGCGDGSFLNHAQHVFKSVVGVEPSAKFADAASKQGHHVLRGYVTSDSLLTHEKFQYFASRQVFEHLPDPLDCLLGVKGMLTPGAIGLIEVPNGYKALASGRYFEFFPDHVNYYSVNSLVALASAAGFNVLSCGPSFKGDYLELWISLENDAIDYFEQMKTQQIRTLDSISKWALSHSSKSENVLFGCGAKTLAIVSQDPLLFENSFSYVVDSDPNKVGKFLPDTSIEVLSIEDDRLNAIKSVWIMALSYVDEISSLVQSKLPSVTEIVTLDSDFTPRILK
jgi:SAM-dependent methyltransferase